MPIGTRARQPGRSAFHARPHDRAPVAPGRDQTSTVAPPRTQPWARLWTGLRTGELPLWNPQLAAGTPHLADPQSAVLYPLTTVPLLLLGPAATARLALPLHFFLAGAFTYGYTRSLCLSRPAATAAGLAYALAPHFAPLGNATYLQQSAAWVPAILWALHTGFDRARLAPFAVAGLLWALQLARGYPQTWYVTGLLAAAYCLVRGAWLLASRRADASPSPPGPAARRPLTRAPAGPGLKGRRGVVVHGGAGASPSPRGPLRGLPGEQPAGREDGRRHPPTRGTAGPIGTLVCGPVLFAAVGLGAGAAQLLPSLDLLAQSHRSGGYSLAEAAGYGAVALANLLGAPGPAVEVTGAFPGGVVLGLALAALLYGRGRGTW